MDWLLDNVSVITGLLLGIGVVGFYGSKVLVVLKETVELLQVTIDKFADSELTKDELKEIIKEAKDVVEAVRDVTKKS